MHVLTTRARFSRVRPADVPTPVEHRGLPPPLALDLFDSDEHVGWIRDNVLGFGGFGNADEAGHSAWVAYRAIWRRHAKQHGLRPHPVVPSSIYLRTVGDRELILASGRPFATLVRPAPDGAGVNSFGFEVELPAPVDERSARSVAYLVYRTLRKSGIRWTLWMREAKPEAEPPHAGAPTGERRRQPVRIGGGFDTRSRNSQSRRGAALQTVG